LLHKNAPVAHRGRGFPYYSRLVLASFHAPWPVLNPGVVRFESAAVACKSFMSFLLGAFARR
jgi:hypothetical protein